MKKLVSLAIICLLMIPSGLVALTVSFTSDKACLGNATTLINRSFTIGDSIKDIMWDLNGDGKFDEEKNVDTVSYTFSFAGAHTVGLKVITYGGEVQAKYQLVYVAEITTGFTFAKGCSYQPIQFTNQTTVAGDAIASYRWDFGDGSSPSIDANPIHQFESAGTFTVWLVSTSIAGCKDSISHPVEIGSQLTVNLVFSGDTVFIKGDSVIAYLAEPYDSVRWSTGAKTNSIVIKKDGYYWVRVYQGICSADKSFRIRVEEYGSDPVVMNVFTPNGDGMNDLWEILNLSKVSPCQVDVFNRYGENVYTNSAYNNDWGGTYKNKLLPNDTYYFFVRCSNKDMVKGTVNILK